MLFKSGNNGRSHKYAAYTLTNERAEAKTETSKIMLDKKQIHATMHKVIYLIVSSIHQNV